MLTKKQKLKNIVEKNPHNTWGELRTSYNCKVGFFDSTLEEKLLAEKFNYELKTNANNFLKAKFDYHVSKIKKFENKIDSFKFIEEKNKFSYLINGVVYSAWSLDFQLDCDVCNKKFVIEGNPKRGVAKYFDSFLCKTCKNSLIHQCEDYKKTYRTSMQENHGESVCAPIQIKKISEKIKNTMIERYGVPYSGLSPELLRKSWSKYKEHGVASKKELEFSEEIKELFFGYKIYDASEPYIVSYNNVTFLPDIVIPELKLIIEFFGDYWHGNPELFKEEEIIAQGKFTRKEVNQKDQKRVNNLVSATGFEVVIVWENDWKCRHLESKEKIRKVKDERISFLATE